MKKEISRRKFVVSTVGAGTGVLILPQLSAIQASGRANPIRPIIISSHSNETGRLAMEAGWEVLRAGETRLMRLKKPPMSLKTILRIPA